VVSVSADSSTAARAGPDSAGLVHKSARGAYDHPSAADRAQLMCQRRGAGHRRPGDMQFGGAARSYR
jgi:hypothetical protein